MLVLRACRAASDGMRPLPACSDHPNGCCFGHRKNGQLLGGGQHAASQPASQPVNAGRWDVLWRQGPARERCGQLPRRASAPSCREWRARGRPAVLGATGGRPQDCSVLGARRASPNSRGRLGGRFSRIKVRFSPKTGPVLGENLGGGVLGLHQGLALVL